MAVRQEVNNFESSVVVQELEFVMNLALYGLLPIHRRKSVMAFLGIYSKLFHLSGYKLQTSHLWKYLRKPLYHKVPVLKSQYNVTDKQQECCLQPCLLEPKHTFYEILGYTASNV